MNFWSENIDMIWHMSRALVGGLKPTLHYWGALRRRHRLELSMVAPEFNKKENWGYRLNSGGASPTLRLMDLELSGE